MKGTTESVEETAPTQEIEETTEETPINEDTPQEESVEETTSDIELPTESTLLLDTVTGIKFNFNSEQDAESYRYNPARFTAV